MELKEEHIGKTAIVTEDYDNIRKGSIVILRALKTGTRSYKSEVIDGKWGNKPCHHTCGGFFTERIGYNVLARRLELVGEEEKEEETITYDLDNPFGGMENFK